MPGRGFKKGYDPRRNTKGRPQVALTPSDIFRRIGKEKIPADVLRLLRKHFPDLADDERRIDALCRVVWHAAERSEPWAVELVFNRAYGKVRDEIAIETTEPLVVFPPMKRVSSPGDK
jgi:hypothetical protein